ncbi:hypothetical protein AX774_g402, partial [Zancudomyces culisetae]
MKITISLLFFLYKISAKPETVVVDVSVVYGAQQQAPATKTVTLTERAAAPSPIAMSAAPYAASMIPSNPPETGGEINLGAESDVSSATSAQGSRAAITTTTHIARTMPPLFKSGSLQASRPAATRAIASGKPAGRTMPPLFKSGSLQASRPAATRAIAS